MTLIEQAQKIINQKAHTQDDLVELNRIKREMSGLYAEMSSMQARQESEYEAERTIGYISIKPKKRKDGKNYTDREAEILAKNKAEEKFGGYRESKAVCMGIREQINALEGFIISIYHKNKRDAKIQ